MLDSDGSASSECHVFVSAIYEGKTCKATEFVAQIIFFSNVIAFYASNKCDVLNLVEKVSCMK